MDPDVFRSLSYGLFVCSVHCGKRDNACIINTAVQVSASPDRIAVSLNKADFTAEMLEYTDDFTLSVLAEDAPFDLFRRFGFRSGREAEKFEGFDDCIRVPNGTLAVTKGTNAYLSAHVEQKTDLGSHVLYLARITGGEVLSSVPSATYAYYHSSIKPQPQKQQAPAEEQKTVFRCTVCGYEVEGETLAPDFVCPICRHGVQDFEQVTSR